MSGSLPKFAMVPLPWCRLGLKPDRLLLLALIQAFDYNGKGESFRGFETYADLLGVSYRSVQRWVVELQEAGLIETFRRQSPSGHWTTYLISWEGLERRLRELEAQGPDSASGPPEWAEPEFPRADGPDRLSGAAGVPDTLSSTTGQIWSQPPDSLSGEAVEEEADDGETEDVRRVCARARGDFDSVLGDLFGHGKGEVIEAEVIEEPLGPEQQAEPEPCRCDGSGWIIVNSNGNGGDGAVRCPCGGR
jgi:hypothetical protein